MKLLMYMLLALNLVLALLGWIEFRKTKAIPVFKIESSASEIRLLEELSAVSGQAWQDERCWLMGPLANRESAESLKSDLAGVDYFAELVETEIKRAPGYWVYYGPIESYEQSLAQLREFKSKGIDSFIIKKKELNGSISVGVFKNIDSAKRMQSIMLRKGYKTKMAEIPKTSTEYWVSIKVPVGGALEERFGGYLEAQKQALEARQIFCK